MVSSAPLPSRSSGLIAVLWRCSQKCAPGTPRCMRCTKMGIEDCVYDNIKKRGVGKTLKMGEACAYCR